MQHSKNQLLQELRTTRTEMWQCLDELDETVEIYPGWKKREFFSHVAGWEAMVFEVFQQHAAKQEPLHFDYAGVDAFNMRSVAVRQSLPLPDAKVECDIYRFAILTLLEQIDDFNDTVYLPWGPNTVTEFVEGAIEHERLHMADIMNLQRADSATK